VLVACRGGELAVLDPSGGAPLVTHRIAGGDLRDVVVSNAGVMVSNFRGAQLIEIDLETGRDISRRTPTSMADSFTGSFDPETGEFTETLFQPAVAWRTIVTPSGDVAMVHQRASDNELQTAPGAYYSTGMCDGSIVQSAVTMFGGDRVSNAPNLQRASLAVDVAVDDDGRVAVVNAGNQSGDGSVVIYEASELGGDAYGTTCVWADSQVAPHVENAISAAFDDAGDLWVQQRDPARLVRVSRSGDLVEAIELGGEPRFDTGHAVFHGNAGRGTACASCHPEGGDDGRTWRFAEIGARRTPSMYGNVTETAPFHWDGDLPTLRELSEVVFTQRMGGPALTSGQVDSLGGWLDRMPPPAPSMPLDRDSVLRGRALFEGEAQCASCHSGGMLTNNQTVDVGTGGAFQVPSLVGLAARLPLMHTGCATTIEERFDARCGGDRHGNTAHLGEDGIADLVAYLETL
jgi:hypothetical protein